MISYRFVYIFETQVISVPPTKRDLKDIHNNRHTRMSKTKSCGDIPKEKITEFCKKWKIREFSLFGSVLREDFRPDSDIDVLVTFSEDAKITLIRSCPHGKRTQGDFWARS